MESKYYSIIEKLQKTKVHHPNLTSLWLKYIELKKKSFLLSMENCEKMIEKLDVIDDIQELTIIFLLFLMKDQIL